MAKAKKISDKSPRKLAKDKQRQHLLNANIECIAKLGLSDTSITHISKAANMSRGIINFYFESKEKMMLETLDFLLHEQEKLWRLADEGDEGNLSAIAEKILLSSSKKQQRAWLAFAAHAASHQLYALKIKRSNEALYEMLKESGHAEQEIDVFGVRLHGLRVELLLDKASLSKEEKCAYVQAVVSGQGGNIQALSGNDNTVSIADKAKPATAPKATTGKPKKAKKSENTDAAIGDLFASLG